MSAVLKPCAHCGGQAEANRYGVPDGAKYSVWCKSCPLATNWMHGEDEAAAKARAIAAWNRRPAPVALTDALPELPHAYQFGNLGRSLFSTPQMEAYARQYAQQCIEARNQQGDAWQPIQTAPKDGTEVLLYLGVPWNSVEMARWYEPWQNWQRGDDQPDPFRDEYCGIGSDIPTHWQPIPAPPAIEQRKADKKGGA